MGFRRERPGLLLWSAFVVGSSAVLVAGLRARCQSDLVSPVVLFWLVTIGAGVCYMAAMGVVVHRLA